MCGLDLKDANADRPSCNNTSALKDTACAA